MVERNLLCNLFDAIKVVSSIDLQRKSWVHGRGMVVSSYSEEVGAILEDFPIKEIAGISERQGLSKSQEKVLIGFTESFEKFVGLHIDHIHDDAWIMLQPEWGSIVALADAVVRECMPWVDCNCADQPGSSDLITEIWGRQIGNP
jgi:hypothetical protein